MKGKDNPLFKISSLVSLWARPHETTLKQCAHELERGYNDDVTTKMLAYDGRPALPDSFSGVWEGGKGSHGPLVEMENYFSGFLSCTSKRREISTKSKDFSHQSFISRLLFRGIRIFVLALDVERFAAMHILLAQLHIKKLIRRENK